MLDQVAVAGALLFGVGLQYPDGFELVVAGEDHALAVFEVEEAGQDVEDTLARQGFAPEVGGFVRAVRCGRVALGAVVAAANSATPSKSTSLPNT